MILHLIEQRANGVRLLNLPQSFRGRTLSRFGHQYGINTRRLMANFADYYNSVLRVRDAYPIVRENGATVEGDHRVASFARYHLETAVVYLQGEHRTPVIPPPPIRYRAAVGLRAPSGNPPSPEDLYAQLNALRSIINPPD
jgi:hypothetical protein